MNLATVEVKAFVPAADFLASKAFYSALGFEIPWSSGALAYVHHGQTSFLLQAFNEPGFIENYQMHLLVENVDDWRAHVLASGVVERFGVRVHAGESALGDARLHAVRPEWRAVAGGAEYSVVVVAGSVGLLAR